MLHANFDIHRTSGSREENLKVFTIYGHDGHIYKLSLPLHQETTHEIWL